MSDPSFAPHQLSRRVATRQRTVPLPDPTAPFNEAPPLLVEDVSDFADIAPVRRGGGPARPAKATSPRAGKSPADVASDFLEWRARWMRKNRRSKGS